MLQDHQDPQTTISASNDQSGSSSNEIVELSLEELMQISGGRRGGGCGGGGCGGGRCGGSRCGGGRCGGGRCRRCWHRWR